MRSLNLGWFNRWWIGRSGGRVQCIGSSTRRFIGYSGGVEGVLQVVQVFTGNSTGCLRVSRQIDAKTRDRKSRQTQIDPGGEKK